jgi:pre-mRNA-splicing helicase BRR2
MFACWQVLEAAGKHQVLIFVHSRKETAKTARFLKEEFLKNDTLAKLLRDDSASREILQVLSWGSVQVAPSSAHTSAGVSCSE